MLSFVYAQFLWGLLFIAWLLWCIRQHLHIPRLQVASLELWEKHILPDQFASQATGYHLWSLLLQILIYVLIILAGAQPIFITTSATRHIAIVLDCSASMQTMDGNTSVFDRALRQLQEMLRLLSPDDTVDLYLYPLHQAYRNSPHHLLRLLAKFRPSQSTLQSQDLLFNFVRTSKQPVFFITDGADVATRNIPGIVYFDCGVAKTDNVGFVALHISQEGQEHRIFSAIHNFSQHDVTTQLILKLDDDSICKFPMQIMPDQRHCWSEKISLKATRTMSLMIDIADNFKLDNHVYAVKNPPVAVWLHPTAPLSLKNVLKVISGIREVTSQRDADVNFVPCSTLFKIAEAGWLVYQGNFDPILLSPEIPEKISNIFWTGDSLLDTVCPELIEFTQTAILRPHLPPHTRILLNSSAGPIMAYGKNWLFFGFPLNKSNWQSLPSFPILWYNFFQYLYPQRDQFSYNSTSQAQYPEIGIHHDIAGKPIAVNLLNEEESNNTGSQTRDIPWPPEHQILSTKNIDLRWYLTLLAIFFLIILWWLWERQTYLKKREKSVVLQMILNTVCLREH